MHTVEPMDVFGDQLDMQSEAERAAQDDQIARIDGQGLAEAEIIKADDGQDNPQPDKAAAFNVEKEHTHYRNEDDIDGVEKASFTGIGIDQPELYHYRAADVDQPAKGGGSEQRKQGRSVIGAFFRRRIPFLEEKNDRDQCQRTENRTAGHEEKRTDIRSHRLLKDKITSPYRCRKDKHEIGKYTHFLCVEHGRLLSGNVFVCC